MQLEHPKNNIAWQSTKLADQTWSVLKFGHLWAFLIRFWAHLVLSMQFLFGHALVSELLQLGLSSTNCTLEWSKALPFYLCSATLTWCFWCDGTKLILSQVLELWLVWMYFFFSLLSSLVFFVFFFVSQRDFSFCSHWHYACVLLLYCKHYHLTLFVAYMCNNTCFYLIYSTF